MPFAEPCLDLARQRLDPELALVLEGTETSLPPFWKGYCSTGKAERLQCLAAEMHEMADYFPETAQRLMAVASDVFLARSPGLGLCRLIAVELNGETYFRYSRCPLGYVPSVDSAIVDLIRTRAPEAITYLYFEMMDGLTDLHDLVGFKNRLALTTVEAEIDTYGEMPDFERLEAMGDIGNIVEILGSGGGGYLLLDLNRDMRTDTDPGALRISGNGGWSPEEPVPLFGMLDAWMAVGLGQTEPTRGKEKFSASGA